LKPLAQAAANRHCAQRLQHRVAFRRPRQGGDFMLAFQQARDQPLADKATAARDGNPCHSGVPYLFDIAGPQGMRIAPAKGPT